MCNNKTSLSYCIVGILISHFFLPFQVLPVMLTVIFEAGYLEMMMESAVLDFFLVLESFLHLELKMNVKTWLTERDNVIYL